MKKGFLVLIFLFALPFASHAVDNNPCGVSDKELDVSLHQLFDHFLTQPKPSPETAQTTECETHKTTVGLVQPAKNPVDHRVIQTADTSLSGTH